MKSQPDSAPATLRTFTSTEYFDIHGHPVLDADGPAAGHLGLGYQFRIGRRHAPDRWVVVVTLSPALYDETGAKIVDSAVKRPLTVAGTAVYGDLDLAAEPTGTVPQASIVFDHYHLATPAPDSQHARAVHTALTQLCEQAFAFFHTPHQLHASMIDHTIGEIAALDQQILDHCSALFPRRAAAIQRRNHLIDHPPSRAEDPAAAPEHGQPTLAPSRSLPDNPRNAHA
ncbi:hypothetical protein [Nocardia altamirensis]|uniref:hypothetical protein n=1 Tax=Nocardia altamirensis TaxID=472158 RepID=UPI0008401215|nr:hypothetical protein [Nocardia altamirensis]